jgi:hypothetical protein
MRKGERYEIRCPVTIELLSRGSEQQSGELQDISMKGARFCCKRGLSIGTEIRLSVHFTHPENGVTTVVFEGAVSRTSDSSPYEIVASFRNSGSFLREGLG